MQCRSSTQLGTCTQTPRWAPSSNLAQPCSPALVRDLTHTTVRHVRDQVAELACERVGERRGPAQHAAQRRASGSGRWQRHDPPRPRCLPLLHGVARVRSRKRAVIFFGWVFFLISYGSPHVRPMGRTCGEPDEIELTAMGVKLNGPAAGPTPGGGRASVATRATSARHGSTASPCNRSISPQWRPIRFRLALCTSTPWGCIVRVVPDRLTKPRKHPPPP